MLKILQPAAIAEEIASAPAGGFNSPLRHEYADFNAVASAARRHWKIVVASILVSATLGLAYAITATPRYTASADILLDRHGNLLPDQSPSLTSLFDSESATLSQIEIVRSWNVAGAVADKLKLAASKEFAADNGTSLRPLATLTELKDLLRGYFGSPQVVPDDGDVRQRSITSLVNNLSVTRTGQTFVLNISYASRSPELAANIVNAFAEAYLDDALTAKAEANRRASAWLKTRIDELKRDTVAADAAVQNFSSANDLISTGGQLISDQQLASLNTLLIEARNDVQKLQPKYDYIQALIANSETLASVTDALGDPVITALQARYADASQREQEVVRKLGTTHAQAKKLRDEMDEYKRLMFQELSRIASTYRSELETAKSRLAGVQQQFDAASGASKVASKSQVELRALQQEADNYRGLYQSYLEHYQKLLQQQSYPVTDARVITPASVPDEPSLPRKSLIIEALTAIGAMIGVLLAAFREVKDRTLHTPADVQKYLQLPFLGYLNDVTAERRGGWPLRSRAAVPVNALANLTTGHAASQFSATICNVVVALAALNRVRPLVVGVVSALEGEGKTTVAANLARVMGSCGQKVVLVDCDWRGRGLTRVFIAGQDEGRMSSQESADPGQGRLLFNTQLGAVLMPAPSAIGSGPPAIYSIPGAFSTVIENCRDQFDCVIIDLPAIGPHSDALASVSAVDVFLLVVDWGKTQRDEIYAAMRRHPQIYEKCMGVILNRTISAELKRHLGTSRGAPESSGASFTLAELKR